MKRLFLFSLITMFFSCTTDEDSPQGESNDTKQVKKVTKYTTSGTLDYTLLYEYNALNNVLKTTKTTVYDEVTVTTFEYDSNDKLISFEEAYTNPWGDTDYELNTLSYDGDLITKDCIHLDFGSFELIDKIDFSYDANDNAIVFNHYESMDADFNTCDEVIYIEATENLEYDIDGNMIRYENDQDFFTTHYYEYDYDTKNHPYSGIKPDAFRKLFGYSTVNNITDAVEFNSDTNEITGTISYDYEYNNNDYPTAFLKNYSSTSGLSQTIRYEYTYY